MINTPASIEGKWWIQGEDNDPHFGILNYDPSLGLELMVKIPQDSGITETLDTLSTPPSVPTSIFGQDKDNHPVSLYGCVLSNYDISGGLKSFTVRSMIGMIGRKVPDWEHVCYNNINAEYSLFHNWMGVSNVKTEGGTELKISVSKRETIEVVIDAQAKLIIWPTFNFNQDSSSLRLSEGHGVEFRFSEAHSVKDSLHKYVSSFRRFLTLLISKPIFVENVYVHPNDDKIPKQVAFYHSNQGVESADRETLYHFMVVSYRDIAGNFGEIIKRWFKLEESLGDVLNLYFATIFTPGLYINQTFLFLAQALEVYHRTSRNFENYAQPKSDFRARKKNIIEKVPEEKNWLTEKLGHANEKTLAQRLDELMSLHKDEVSKFIDDPKEFSDLVRHTRNHYTHYGTEEKGMEKVATGIQLMDLTAKMRTLLELCIFADLGISGDPINRMIQKLKDLRYSQL